MSHNERPYRQASCDFTDQLEAYAIHKTHVRLVALTPGDQRQEMRGRVEEIFTQDHADFIKLQDGRTVRVDQILELEAA